jgi:hypothetical protein
MKTYQIELKRTSYINVTVEANNVEEAEQLAWDELQSDGSYELTYADWEIESIELDQGDTE